MKSSLARRLGVALAVACLLLPAWSMAARAILYFVADFEQTSSADAPTFMATGGVFVVQGPPGVFNVVVDSSGDGVLSIAANSLQSSATLTGVLNQPSHDSQIDVSLSLTPAGPISDLTVSMIDDGNSGMLDLEFEDEDGGKLTVAGQTLQLGGGTGNTSNSAGPYSILLSFKSTLLGVNTWQLIVTGANGNQTLSGLLPPLGPLSLGKVRITRPGGVVSGSWSLDDLIVSSPGDNGLVIQ